MCGESLWHVPDIRWSETEQAWIMNGVEVHRPVYWDDVEVSCVIYEADGNGTSFTAFFFPVELSTTTTTVEWTYPTYTTFEIPPLPPVYVISCNESLLPEPPEKDKTWNCTKPGEGQECRAICRGYPDQMTSVTCLKGQSSLEWFVTNVCPVFTTTTLDMTIDTPADNAILSTILVFVFILIFLCSAGIFALMAYGLYKFTMNDSKSRVSSVKISREETAMASADKVVPLIVESRQNRIESNSHCRFRGSGRGDWRGRSCFHGLGEALGRKSYSSEHGAGKKNQGKTGKR